MNRNTRRFPALRLRSVWAARLIAAGVLVALGIYANAALSAPNPGAGPESSPAPSLADPFVAGFDCSQVHARGIDRQTNLRAQLIMQRCDPQSSVLNSQSSIQNLALRIQNSLVPALGAGDADVILPDGNYAHVTQSETMIAAHDDTVVVNYVDSRTAPSCYSGVSYSTDSGATWQHNGQPLCTGHGTNYGDPILVWDDMRSRWLAGDLATGCGGQGIGFWTSPDGVTWAPGSCVNMPPGDGDRPALYADNNPASPNYGTIIASYNNFGLAGPPVSVVRSTDGGATWSTPLNLSLPSGVAFVRNMLDTAGPDGTFFVTAINEHGSSLGLRTNYIYRSTDGGVTWGTAIQMGPDYYSPGVETSGYWALMFHQIWRYMGWGQPGAGPGGVVHYAYTQHGSGGDSGDVYYQRSTDDGLTWSLPVRFNTDSSGNGNWAPSLAVTADGAVLVSWYDGRNGASLGCGGSGSNTPCYERWGRVSLDNGVTWQAEADMSSAISPLPAQPDLAVQTTYEGDYDAASADGTNAYTCWNDGRVIIAGTAQQDVFCERVPLIVGTPTPTVTGTPPTATPTRTQTPTPTPTVTPCSSGVIANGGFETGALAPWTVWETTPSPVVSTDQAHSGSYAALLGTVTGPASYGDSSIYQTITVPPGGGTLSFWWYGLTADSITYDWQNVYITDTTGNILTTVMHTCQMTYGWVHVQQSLAAYAGQAVRVEFMVHQNGSGGDTAMYVDDVFLITACATGTPATSTPTNTVTPLLPTGTVLPSSTPPLPTGSPTGTAPPLFPTGTPLLPTSTELASTTPAPPTSTATPLVPTATSCPIRFSDVHPADYFYTPVGYLACAGVISGYADGTFRPYANTTRAQMAKIAVLGFAIPLATPPPGGYSFEDVRPDHPFFRYIETAAAAHIMSGYNCGGPGDPCDPQYHPFFHPYDQITRGQIAKVVALAAHWPLLNPSDRTFEDVLPGSAFYLYVETAAARGVVSGYACGAPPAGPCGSPPRPYFLQGNNAVRGQIAKFVYLAIRSPLVIRTP